MRIASSLFVDPRRNTLYGAAAIALCYFIFAYSSLFGKLPILVYYGLWLPLVLVDYRKALANPVRYTWILAFAVLACLSVFWSRAFGVSARAAVQYLTHVICILIVARTIAPRTFALGSLFGALIVVAYSLADGRHFYDPLDGTFSLVGAFASKNQLGFFASLGVFFAFATLWIYRERWPIRVIAILSGIICLYTLHASDSATSVIGLAVAVCAMVAVTVLRRFAPSSRSMLLVGALIVAAGLAFVAINSGAIAMVLGAFNKSTSLTGRTYLWAQGLAQSAQAPVLGVGYQAYWVQGFPGPERLWEQFYIASRTGFHFHDTYIETLVELGYFGAILLSIVLIAALVGHTRRLIAGRDMRSAHLMTGVCVLLLVRSFVEVDILAPYQIGSFLLYYAAGLIAAPQAGSARAAVRQTSTARTSGKWTARPEGAAQ